MDRSCFLVPTVPRGNEKDAQELIRRELPKGRTG